MNLLLTGGGTFKKWWSGKKESGGTAFFVTLQGHLITNKHVVERNTNYFLFPAFADCFLKVRVIARHPTLDVALLKIDEPYNGPFSCLKITSVPGKIGDWVFSLRGRGWVYESNHLLLLPSIGKIIGHVDPYILLSMAGTVGNSG